MKTSRLILLLFVVSCAGFGRDCASCTATEFGADWIVLQYSATGAPINCWKLENTSIDNEAHSDGIYWRERTGHLVHISGWYNRVQVQNNDFKSAASSIGVELEKCADGKYK